MTPTVSKPAAVRTMRAHAAQSQGARALFWLQVLMLVQFGCQLALLFDALASLRIVWRCLAFGVSLAFLVVLVLVRGRSASHPSQPWALGALAFLGLAIIHPNTNTLAAGIGQYLLYLAVLSPLFWVGRFAATPKVLRRVMLLFWIFQTSSAAFGVLQASFPGRFQPHLSSAVEAMGERMEGLKVTLANGEKIFRPMGLTDQPGGAAASGMYAVLFGLGVLLTSRGVLRVAAVAGLVLGLFCIYLCQIRSLLIMTAISVLVLGFVLVLRAEWTRVIILGTLVTAAVLVSFVWAVAVGGQAVTDRYATLTEDSAPNVYYKSRGRFLEQTVFEYLPEYPFGAGLGRWGFMRGYFGDENNSDSEMIYVEIQWTGWLLDGGLPLVIAYTAAVVLACVTAFRITFSRLPNEITLAAGLIFAYDISVVAVTFNYPMFISQGGVDFWLINTLIFTAACNAARQARLASPGGRPSAVRT